MSLRTSTQIAAVMARVDRLCQDQRLRLTETRQQVLQLIVRQSGGIKAYDLLAQLQQESPGAKPPTVYRALDFLIEHGFIHRIESLNAFFSCTHPDHGHSFQVLICKHCGDIKELHSAPVESALEQEAHQHRFQLLKNNVELIGICPNCQ